MADPLPRDYWRFWTASTLSNLGDGLRLVALPLLAADLTRSPLLISGVEAAAFLPWVVVGPISGVVVDRLDRRRLIVVAHAVRGLAVAGFAVAVAQGRATIALVYAIAAIVGTGETFADTGAQAAVPRLVERRHLDRANSRLVLGQVATNDIAGAPVGGALFALGAALPFAVDAATYLVAAVLVLAVRRDLRPAVTAPTTATIRADVAEGLRWLWRHPVLRPVAASVAAVNLGLQAQAAILVLFALEVLDIPAVGFGLLLGAGAVGGLAGAALAEHAVARFGRSATMVRSTLLSAVAVAAVGLAPNAVVAAVAWAVATGAIGAFNVVGRTLRQAVTPGRLLGRVVTAFRLVGLGTIPIGAVVGGAVAEVAGLRAPFLLAAVVTAAAAVGLGRAIDDHAIAASLPEAEEV